jgi:hypothetical protein
LPQNFALAILVSFVHAAGELFAVLIFHTIIPFPFRQQETAKFRSLALFCGKDVPVQKHNL